MGSEDVGVFGMSADLKRYEIPVVYFRLGAMDPEKLAAAKAAGKRLPGPHTSHFEPAPEADTRDRRHGHDRGGDRTAAVGAPAGRGRVRRPSQRLTRAQ